MLSKVTENRKSLFEIGLCKSKPIHSRDPDPAGTSVKFDILEALAFYVKKAIPNGILVSDERCNMKPSTVTLSCPFSTNVLQVTDPEYRITYLKE